MKIISRDSHTIYVSGCSFGRPPSLDVRQCWLKDKDGCHIHYPYFYQSIETIVLHSTYSYIKSLE